MQTHVRAPAEQSEQHQSTRRPAQLLAESQSAFRDNRAESAQLKTLQTMMGNSQQHQKSQILQAHMETGTLGQSFIPNTVALQRVEEEEPVEPVQKFESRTAQREATVEASKPNNTGLPNQLKAGIESLSGMSMDHVNVHYNSDKPAQLNAHAYAQGSDIHVAPGQEQHLPHEAWHVVQQAQGRVKPTMQMKGDVPVNDDAGLESEADAMGAKALGVGAQVANGAVSQHKQIESGNRISATSVSQCLSVYRKGNSPANVKKPRVSNTEIDAIKTFSNNNFVVGPNNPDLSVKASAWIEGGNGGLSVNTDTNDPGFQNLRGNTYQANTDSFGGLELIPNPVGGQPNHHLVRPNANTDLAGANQKFNGIDWA